MDKKQEKCLIILDKLVDNGIDIEHLRRELPEKKYHTLRKRLIRAFGSTKDALAAFGLNDYDDTILPTEFELNRCYYIDEYYKVRVNEYRKERIKAIYNLSEPKFNFLSRKVRRDFRKDALDEFYRNEFPDNTKWEFISKDEYVHLKSYIVLEYGSLYNFLEFYGAPRSVFIDFDHNRRNEEYIQKGHIFEHLVKEVLEILYEDVKYHFKVGECIPDFIINGNDWIDAKLSFGTVFHPKSNTLDKYLKYTKNLTIIYARKNYGGVIVNRDDVILKHISEFYPALLQLGRVDVVDQCEYFLESLETTKKAG